MWQKSDIMGFFSRKEPTEVPDSINQYPVDSRSFQQESSEPLQREGTTPYLGLTARLSQVWLNRWTILLILVLVRVLLSLASLNNNLDEAKVKALAACSKVEDVGSAMASMPHYLSVGVNRLAASGITNAVHGMMKILDMVLTAVEQLILFVINWFTATYTCLIAALVHAGLNVSAAIVTKTTDAVNAAIKPIAEGITKSADGIEGGLNGITNFINKIPKIPGLPGIPSIPKVDFGGDLDKLKNVKIDSSGFVADINKLNNDLPTFREIQNMTAGVVSMPFNLVRKELDKAYGNWGFDDSVFPVAKKEALTFCTDNSSISDFFQKLYELANTAKTIFLWVICIAAVAVCAPMAWWEMRGWRRTNDYHKVFMKNKHDEMDIYLMSASPWISKMAIKIANKLSNDPKRQALIRWTIAYATTIPALFVLSLALAGFFSCLLQYLLLVAIEKEVPALANEVGDFSKEVVTKLDTISVKWANDANKVITVHTDEINHDVLGYVVNATSAVNKTLNTFTDGMDKALTTAFKGTILMDPIKEIVFCLVGMKVETVQKGLTWVHDHAHVSFPLFPNDTFSAGAQKSVSGGGSNNNGGDGDSDMTSFLADPASATTDEVTGAVSHVTDFMRAGIVQEALISLGLLLVYLLVVLIGVSRLLYEMATNSGVYEGQDRRNSYQSDAMKSPRPSSVHSSSEDPADRQKYQEGSTFYAEDGGAENPFGSGAQRVNDGAGFDAYYNSARTDPQR